MVSRTIVIVEGPTDKAFVTKVIDVANINVNHEDIWTTATKKQDSGGWANLKKRMEMPDFGDAKKNNAKFLIIFDADTHYADRKARITNDLKSEAVTAPIFLFPNDNDVGDLEKVLEEIIPTANRKFLNCWESYSNCIKLKNGKEPSQKSKIHEYCAAVLGQECWNHGGMTKCYGNEALFDFASPSPALDSLKEFLRQNVAI